MAHNDVVVKFVRPYSVPVVVQDAKGNPLHTGEYEEGERVIEMEFHPRNVDEQVRHYLGKGFRLYAEPSASPIQGDTVPPAEPADGPTHRTRRTRG